MRSKVGNIIVVSQPIFDLSDPESFFIHRWANALHINTQEDTILNNMPFDVGDEVNQREIEEAQRLLRAEAYIRDAKVTMTTVDDPDSDATQANGSKQVIIETWDNWSLLPTASFGSSGGETKFSFGIKEDNLLGLGIRTRVKYQSSADRTGYKFEVTAPFQWIKHAKVSASFLDNSDGTATHLAFYKPFYALNTQYMYGAKALDDTRTDTLRQNGVDINQFEHKTEYANVQFGWLAQRNEYDLHRISVGATFDRNTFDNLSYLPDSPLPQNREFAYPWIGYEYIEDEFSVLNNIYLISNNEDFNLGWYHKLRLGLELNDTKQDHQPGYHVDWFTSHGIRHDNHLLLMSLDAELTQHTAQDDRYKIALRSEYFYHINPKWTAYSKIRLASSKHNYLDDTFALGDDTGIRGYPNDYQYGDNQWAFTAELRNYPNINLYQLANLGWALFSDVGQATGGTDDNNEINDVIGSVGVGARIYSSKSSYGNVAHIDLAVPFTQGNEINDWEFRFQVKNHF
ncbi:hypothetical protein G3R48_09185 [Shewanella intestini]|uniref:Haemolysin activator HlyB C-terminal domain-containing protein n=1 Tax=Shewanella intestini TaxID=2017544 RepID=A0ABS5I2D1_9GAMM|nr:hypothetical protein [Shewanella intestini]MRG36625.1 hypothetical protein [Shewanella sp. XMDDZSB0408]